MKANFPCAAKTQLGFRDTVSPNQVQGSMLKGIREQSSQEFYKFGDVKTIKLPIFSVILWYLFKLPFNYKMDIVSFPTKNMINLNISFNLFTILFSYGA